MDKNKVSAEAIAHFSIAKGDMDRLNAYLGRGRRFRDIPQEQLDAAFVMVWWKLSDHIQDPASRLDHDDVTAEFQIRNIEPPYHLVRSEMDQVLAAIAELVEALPEERKDKLNSEMIDEYFEGRNHSN